MRKTILLSLLIFNRSAVRLPSALTSHEVLRRQPQANGLEV